MSTLDPWPPADPLTEALHFLRMNGAFYCRSELSAPWGMTLDPMPGYLWFHVVTDGGGWLETEKESVFVRQGELALVPRGEGHRLRSDRRAAAPDVMDLGGEMVSDRYELIRAGGGGEPTTLLCGAVRFEHPAARNLVAALPPILHVGASNSPHLDWLRSAIGMMAAEVRTPRPGGEAVVTRLGDILVVEAIRTWIQTDPAAHEGWIGALRDPQIGKAIALIHRDPARDWTVASLAAEVAMSRSALAARFASMVGEPVMQYLTRWRMHLALDALREEDASVGELADRLGYRSEAAFARAFKRVIGESPGAVRRGEAAVA